MNINSIRQFPASGWAGFFGNQPTFFIVPAFPAQSFHNSRIRFPEIVILSTQGRQEIRKPRTKVQGFHAVEET